MKTVDLSLSEPAHNLPLAGGLLRASLGQAWEAPDRARAAVHRGYLQLGQAQVWQPGVDPSPALTMSFGLIVLKSRGAFP